MCEISPIELNEKTVSQFIENLRNKTDMVCWFLFKEKYLDICQTRYKYDEVSFDVRGCSYCSLYKESHYSPEFLLRHFKAFIPITDKIKLFSVEGDN